MYQKNLPIWERGLRVLVGLAAVKSCLHRARMLVRATLQGRAGRPDRPYEGSL